MGRAEVVVGWGSLWGARPEILSVVVDSQVRSQGVGSALVKACEEWARGRGFSRIRVRSNAKRERAHAFYIREGYTQEKQQAVFEKDL